MHLYIYAFTPFRLDFVNSSKALRSFVISTRLTSQIGMGMHEMMLTRSLSYRTWT
ncbi:hypothetical protein HanPI659440_Chr08g0297251 [Helianthus annuus]|nr:hypothetical protein HanPI659440_Chr08g0297251 [Helianthus annuus]